MTDSDGQFLPNKNNIKWTELNRWSSNTSCNTLFDHLAAAKIACVVSVIIWQVVRRRILNGKLLQILRDAFTKRFADLHSQYGNPPAPQLLRTFNCFDTEVEF